MSVGGYPGPTMSGAGAHPAAPPPALLRAGRTGSWLCSPLGVCSGIVVLQFLMLSLMINLHFDGGAGSATGGLGGGGGGGGGGGSFAGTLMRRARATSFLRKLYYAPDVAHILEANAAGGPDCAAPGVAGKPVGAGRDEPVTEPFVTRQQCYQLADESEICVYDGPVCVNNGDQILVGAPAEETRTYAMEDDARTRCLDYRYFERHDGCAYAGPFKRPNLPEEWYKKPKAKAQSADKPPSMPFMGRRWGPDEHASRIDALPWDTLIAMTDPQRGGLGNLPSSWQRAAASVDRAAALDKLHALPYAHGLRGGPMTSVRWVSGSAYVIPMEGGWLDHPWHWATATFSLWDAKLQNFTQANNPLWDGTPGPLNYTQGGYYFPPMDYVIPQGVYMPFRYETTELIPWADALYPLLTQKHTKLMLNGNLLRSFNSTPTDYVCFTRGAITGLKPRIFTSVGDAHAFKLLSYAAAGVKSGAHGPQPPRTITVMGRFSRGFADMSGILRILKATGLPVRVVEDLRFMTWKEQVALMADTGILLAAHGGALANVMYMPAHAVVIEAFPYVTYFTMYQRLAQVANLQYYRLRGFRPPPVLDAAGAVISDPWASYDESDFVYDCEWPHHTSGINAMLQRTCNGKTKITPIAIDEGTFRAVLDMALDDIECKDSICRFDTPGESMYYKDMATNETWTPIMSQFFNAMLPAEQLAEHLAKSRGVMGRIWAPKLFARDMEAELAKAALEKKMARERQAEKAAAERKRAGGGKEKEKEKEEKEQKPEDAATRRKRVAAEAKLKLAEADAAKGAAAVATAAAAATAAAPAAAAEAGAPVAVAPPAAGAAGAVEAPAPPAEAPPAKAAKPAPAPAAPAPAAPAPAAPAPAAPVAPAPAEAVTVEAVKAAEAAEAEKAKAPRKKFLGE